MHVCKCVQVCVCVCVRACVRVCVSYLSVSGLPLLVVPYCRPRKGTRDRNGSVYQVPGVCVGGGGYVCVFVCVFVSDVYVQTHKHTQNYHNGDFPKLRRAIKSTCMHRNNFAV